VGVLVLTLIYWLSDIAVAFWIGGLLAAALLFSAPLDVSPENLALLIHSASTPIDLLDRLRPFQIGAGVILIASIIFGFVLERAHRRAVRWWIVWFVRSAAIMGLIVTGIYGAGDLRDRIKNIESLRDQLQSDLVTVAPRTQSDAGVAAADSANSASTYARQLAAEAHTSYRAAGSTFMSWAWIEALLGAFILLVSAYREASWRRKAERTTTDSSPTLPENEPIDVELIPPIEPENASERKDSDAVPKPKSDDSSTGKRG